jgi:hypothetical protein
MEISFNCDKCGQSLTIDEAGAGIAVQCPKCGQSLTVPQTTIAPQPKPTNRPIAFHWRRMIVATSVVVALAVAVVAMTHWHHPRETSPQVQKTDGESWSGVAGAGASEPIPDGNYSLTLTMVGDSCGGGVAVGSESQGKLNVVTDSQGHSTVSFETAFLAIPNLIGFPAPGIQGTLIAVSRDEFKWGWPRTEMRITNDGDKHFSVHLSSLTLRKMDKGFRICENEYRGKATLKSDTKG